MDKNLIKAGKALLLTKEWLISMYEKEINEVIGTIENESIWKLGCINKEYNPHTDNIEILQYYIYVLTKLKEVAENM